MTIREATDRLGLRPGADWVSNLEIVGIAGPAYFVAAIIGLFFFATPQLPAAIWVANGVALAMLLTTNRRLWSSISFMVFFAAAAANWVAGKHLGISLSLGVVDALEVLLAANLLTHFLGPRIEFTRLRDLAGLLLWGAAGANGVAALLGGAVFAIGAHSPFWFSCWMWWLTNGLGMLVITPCIVSWSQLLQRRGWRITRLRTLEAFVLMAGLAVAADAVFGYISSYSLVLPYVTFPFLIWAALRFGVQGGSTATLLLASIAVWNTAHDLGPFTIAGGTVGEKLVQVQSFILAGLACSLVPAIVMAERETAENNLRRSEARLALAHEIAGLGTFEFDFIQNRVNWSDQAFRIAGRDPASGPPTPAEHLASMHPDDREMMMGELAGVREGRVSDVDYRYVRDDGSVKYVHVIAQPVKNQHGQVVRALGTVMDITDRKRIEEELRQAQKMEAVGRLAGGVAHDFNNLLGVIIGYAELALADMGSDNPARSKIEPISKAASRAASLTAQLLAFSRKQVLKPEVLSLNTVVSDLGKILRRVIGEQIELETDLQSSLLVKADPNQLDQVLLNLAVNAKDAMPNGGKLVIRTGELRVPAGNPHPAQVPAGHYAVLTVSDTGRGMDELTRAHIFEPFFTTKEKGKGTGLGLATVYGIVSQSSGHVWVESAPGAGATFHICLPAATTRPSEIVDIAGPSSPATRSETVLLVEDEEPLRELIREVLTSMGCRVLESTSGEHALELVKQYEREIDVVLTDVIMPRMNGFELSRKIADLCPGIKVLFMSGYSDEMIARHDTSVTQTCFIQKPFKPEELREKLHEIVGTGVAGKRPM